MKGKVLIVSAPSGSGKSTIVNFLMKEHPEFRLAFSVSATSRPPRGQEQDGVDYYFLSAEEFRRHIEADDFLEYEEVYEGRFYGTLKSQVEEKLAAGKNVVFDVDVKGGINIKKYYGDAALSVFIQPPSVEALRERLIGRNTDEMGQIEQRLAKAEYEMSFASQFDRILVNDNLEVAKQEAVALLNDFLAEPEKIS
ncbi:MAG: guanylate kinase [Bacteroidaceae bacterium]|nr:guanylate kinase [Bacteroidaceae bacterium]